MKKEIKYIIWFVIVLLSINFVGQKVLLYGINKFYGLKQYSKLLIVDASKLMLAINKQQLEDGTDLLVSKYTREGVTVSDKYYMLEQVFNTKYVDSIQIVLYGVDQFTFSNERTSENAYKLFYPFMDDPVMDNYVKENASDWRDYYSHKLFPLSRYTDALINASIRGWRNDYSNKKDGVIDIEKYRERSRTGRQIYMQPYLVDIFEKSMQIITDKNIRVILISSPIVDVLNDFYQEERDSVIRYFEEYAENNDLIEYWNLIPEYSSNYSIFYDPIHLNPQGQEIVTREIISRINKLKKND